MLKKWKLRTAYRDLAAARKYEEQRRDEIKHLQEAVLPEIERRIQVTEFAILRNDYQAALANPCTPASQSSHLINLALQQDQERQRRRHRWGFLLAAFELLIHAEARKPAGRRRQDTIRDTHASRRNRELAANSSA